MRPIRYFVDPKKCIICGGCFLHCGHGAIVKKDRRAYIRPEKCVGCGNCVCRCLTRSIRPVPPEGAEQEGP